MVFFRFQDLINFYATQIPPQCLWDTINSQEIQQFLLTFPASEGTAEQHKNLVKSRMKDNRKTARGTNGKVLENTEKAQPLDYLQLIKNDV